MSPRYVYAVAAILILSAAYGCWCQAPLIWDGAYQFDMTLALQHPYVYLTRFHTFFLWYPTVWASRLTSNVNVLQTIYGLPFLLAPATGLLLSWWIVKKHAPYLMMWVIFGVGAATVPGQIFVINDSFFQLHLFWPLFVAMFVPLTWPRRIALGILAVFQFAHPLGVPLTFGAAAAASLVAIADRDHRRRLLTRAAFMATLCLLAGAKIVITNHIPQFFDQYAQQEATWANAQARWRTSVSGAPLSGLRLMWAAAGLILIHPLLRRRSKRLAQICGALAAFCVLWAATHWIYRAHGPFLVRAEIAPAFGEGIPLSMRHISYRLYITPGPFCFWGGAIDYRRWVGPLAAPFFLCATVESILFAVRRRGQDGEDASPRPMPDAALRGRVAVTVALLFALVLGMQYATWHDRARMLMAVVHKYPRTFIPDTDPALGFIDHSPLAHWGTGNYVSAMQGKKPAKIFLDEETEKSLRAKYFDTTTSDMDRSRLGWSYYSAQPDAEPGPAGWFDFRPALQHARQEQFLPSRREPGKVLNGIP